jgi:general secretion pathway protein K
MTIRAPIRTAFCTRDRTHRADAAAAAVRRSRAGQQGMAVIAALLVVSAAAVIAATMLRGQNERAQLLLSEKSRVQARLLMLGAVDWAREILRDDARHSPVTSKDQPWATPIADMRIAQDGQPGAALLSGRIDDEQGKFNLQNLAADGQVDPRQLAAFERLLQALDLRPSVAPDIARRIAGAQPLPTGNGAQNGGATPSARQALPPRAPGLQWLDDLRGMDGLDGQAIERLRCCVTILPGQTAVNVNTAAPEVLYAVIERLSLGQAVAVAAERDRGRYFNDAADFANRLANPEIKLDKDSVSTGSQWFALAGVVRLDRATVAMRALLERDDDQSTSIAWMREMN